MGIPGTAWQAPAADDVAFRRYAIANLHVGDQLPDFGDVSGKLVPDHKRWPAASPCPVIPLVDVHIRAADARAPHANEDFVVEDLGNRDVGQLETRTGVMFYERLHLVSG
jgi:hypothetical protein